MRRSGIKRKSPIRAARGTAAKGMLNRGPTKKRRDSGTRSKVSKGPLRDPEHLARVRRHACVTCRLRVEIEAHHIRECFPRTMGKRIGDNWVVPLCRWCHIDVHGMSRTFWHNAQVAAIPLAATLYAETLSLRGKAKSKSSVALQPRREG